MIRATDGGAGPGEPAPCEIVEERIQHSAGDPPQRIVVTLGMPKP
jgi:hypothetical protein